MHGAFYASLRLDAIRRRAAITYRAECGLHAALRADAMHGCAVIAAVRQGSAICFLTVLAVLTINLKAKIPRRRAFWGLVGAVFVFAKVRITTHGCRVFAFFVKFEECFGVGIGITHAQVSGNFFNLTAINSEYFGSALDLLGIL